MKNRKKENTWESKKHLKISSQDWWCMTTIWVTCETEGGPGPQSEFETEIKM